MQLEIVGDEIWYGGYMVGIFAQDGVPNSVLDQFRDGLENATLFESEQPIPVNKFMDRAKSLAKGGLIRYNQLETLQSQMEAGA